MTIGLTPLDIKGAAIHDHTRMPRSPSRDRRSYRSGTGTSATSHRNATATLPHPHAQAIVTHLSKLDVTAFRETGMPFQDSTLSGNVHAINLIHKDHIMRVAHRDESTHGKGFTIGQEQTGILQYRSEHIDGHSSDNALTIHVEVQGLDARSGHQPDVPLVGQATLIDILADASAGIATHEPFGSIGVEDAHSEIGLGSSRTANEHQTITADAKVVTAPSNGQCLGVGNGVKRGVNKDVIIAYTVHFYKMNFLHIHSILQVKVCKYSYYFMKKK